MSTVFHGALTARFELRSSEDAKAAARGLIDASTPFAVEPLPDDAYAVTVKWEYAKREGWPPAG